MNTSKPVVLVAPLDWGFGHTTRCVPIIKELQANGAELLVACNSKQRLLLLDECPSVTFVDLPGYDIYYGKNRLLTVLSLLFQVRKILSKIKRERRWLSKFIKQNRVDAIVSDNRYGLTFNHLTSVFITHQLRVRSGLGVWVDDFIQKRLYTYINKFSMCWVPDWESPDISVAGELSHPKKLPGIPVKFIGCLSRLTRCDTGSKTVGLLVILSGPEPQRTALEEIIFSQLHEFPGSITLIRGVLDNRAAPSFNNVTILSYVSTSQLNTLICEADLVVCRAGYTSVMDLLKLAKKAILIPTPGQAEQEYLARRLHEQNRAVMVSQESFRLTDAFRTLSDRRLMLNPVPMDNYKDVVAEFCRGMRLEGLVGVN